MPGKSRARQKIETALAIDAIETGQERWEPGFIRLAEDFSYLGATNDEIAARLNVGQRTFDEWIATKPALRKALDKGREVGLSRVARSMHRAAVGYKHRETKLVVVGGKVEKINVTKHYPPSVNAATLLLVNRDGKRWKDRKVADVGVTLDLGELVREALDRRSARTIEGVAERVKDDGP